MVPRPRWGMGLWASPLTSRCCTRLQCGGHRPLWSVSRPILWLVRRLIPGESIRGFKSPLVTASVMDAPELQVLEAQREAERHHEVTLNMLRELSGLLDQLDSSKKKGTRDRLTECENLGARYETEVKGFLERLARSKLSGATYRQVQFLLDWTTEMGQIVQIAGRFAAIEQHRDETHVFFVPKQRKQLLHMLQLLTEAMESLGRLNGPVELGQAEAETAIGMVDSRLIELDAIRQQMRTNRKEDIRKGRYTLDSAMAFHELGELLEEMGLRMGMLGFRYADTFHPSKGVKA